MSIKSICVALVPWVLAFVVPFVSTVALLFEHQRRISMWDLQRDRVMLEQPESQPGDEEAARESAVRFSSLLAVPVGFVGLGVYGTFLAGRKLLKRRKD